MTYKPERYYFACSVIGPDSTIYIYTKSGYPGYGVAVRDTGEVFDIYDIPDFLNLAAVLGCEIKTY